MKYLIDGYKSHLRNNQNAFDCKLEKQKSSMNNTYFKKFVENSAKR